MTKRRDFIKQSAFGAAGLTIGGMGLSAQSYSKILGANDRFRVAVCGLHGRGKSHINGFTGLDNVDVAYLVDPDRQVLDEKVKELQARDGVNHKVGGVTDLRKVLDMKDIDAISSAAPNHWHSLMVIWAAQAGKHIYVEKPVSHDVYEGRVALAAQEKYGIVVQHGTQRRSSNDWAKQVSEIHSGKYGKMVVSHGFACKPREGIGFAKPSPPPKELDWNLWRGPAVLDHHHSNLVHYNWHWFWKTGNGEMNNQGTHQLDVAYWALDPEVANTHPVRVMALGGRFVWDDQGETPNTMYAIAEFKNGQKVFFNVRNVNHEGYVREVTNRFYFEDGGKLWDGEYISNKGSKPRNVKLKDVGIRPGGEWLSFVNACRAGDPEMANGTMRDAHYSTTMGHLMNISYRLGKKVPFNKKAAKFGDDKIAYEEFMKIHAIARDGMGVPENGAEYIVGPWLEFDGDTERFVGDHATEANELLADPRMTEFYIPSPDKV